MHDAYLTLNNKYVIIIMPDKKIRGDLMKKIVATTLIVAAQLLVGGLFLVTLFTGNEVDKKVVIVENNNLSRMVDLVSELYILNDLSTIDNKTEVVEIKENETIKEQVKDIVNNQKVVSQDNYKVLDTYFGVLTGYGPDCYGCSGRTSSGYDVSNTITYNDSEYGEIRILAAGTLSDTSTAPLDFYSIVRVSNVPNMEPFIAIVLDRGGNVGYGKGTLFDLLFSSESEAMHKTDNVKFEILRYGKN